MSAESARAYRKRQKQKIERLAWLEAAHRMNEALLQSQGKRLEQLEDVIRDAEAIAGQMSILFPAKHIETNLPSRASWEIANRPNMSVYQPIANFQDISFSVQRLRVMLGQIEENALHRNVHFLIKFGDQRWGYALSDGAIRSAPRKILSEEITRNLGKVIGYEVKE